MKVIHLILAMLLFNISYAQISIFNKKQYPSIGLNYAYGNIIPTTDFVKGDNLVGKPLKHYQSVSLRLLWQNPGYKKWQRVYNCPYYGGGVSINNFFNEKEVGTPISVYGILGIPLKRWNKLETYLDFQFGASFNWRHYDSISNPKNLVIGGGITVHLNIGLMAYYHISKNIDLGAGVGFIHFSNGGMERPNRGFNIYSPTLEIKYHLGERPPTKSINPPLKKEKSNSLLLMLGYGNHQLVEHELDTNYFAIAGISAIYFKQLSNAFRLGLGSDINYWFGLNAGKNGTIGPRTFDNFTLGIILQPELCIDKLSISGGIGIYAMHLNYGNFKQLYQRLGVRYEVYKNWSFGINVRAINFMLAEFLEFNLSYKLNWSKTNIGK